MKWMKWQHTYAYGPGDWQWLEVEDEKDADSRLGDLMEEYSWADKYRGIEYTLHDAPDREWLEKYVKTTEDTAKYYVRHAEKMKALLAEMRNA